jgi:KDO2-lipid IV(A) lauroyltransferase
MVLHEIEPQQERRSKYAKITRMGESVKGALEYLAAYTLLKTFGLLPRSIALALGELVAAIGFTLARRQRLAGMRNLQLALPQLDEAQRRAILRECFSNLGRLLVEFSRFPRLHKGNISQFVVYDGLEHYLKATQRGNGVIFLTGHFGAWEFSSFAHSVHGYPMKFVVRPIDNPRVEALIEGYRSLAGNVPLTKRNASRDILRALRNNETVGILIDQNTTRDEGVFVDFFGIPASTTPVIATLALRTRAAVIPGFMIWDKAERKHRLRFEPAMELSDTGDRARDILENTRKFNAVLERIIRQYPDQWLWIHRRWKTRPEGEPSLY